MTEQREYHVEPLVWVYGEKRVAELIVQLESEGWRHPATQCIEDAEGQGLNILIMSRAQREPEQARGEADKEGHCSAPYFLNALVSWPTALARLARGEPNE